MSRTEVETVGARADLVKVALSAAMALAGVVGYSFWAQLPLAARLGILFAGLAGGLALFWFTDSGRRLVGFGRESAEEARRVTWPTMRETVQATGVVFAFVALMAVFLFAVDSVIEYGLYDLILGWKR
jgi:preprotein translocase subunit SecE